MGTATVAAVISKNEQAILLRTQAAALDKEIAQLTSKLGSAQATLDQLESQYHELAAAVADGKPQTSAAVLHTKIADAKMPIGVLQNRLSAKQADRNQITATLETLESEIQAEKYQADRRAQVEVIVKHSLAITTEIAAAQISLMEKLTRYDTIKRQLNGVIETSTLPNGRPIPGLDAELAAQARAAVAQMKAELFDGDTFRAEKNLLRQGYVPQYPEIVLHPMRPPR